MIMKIMKRMVLMAAGVGLVVACNNPTTPDPTPAPIDIITFTDERDGQIYRAVKIGTQVWMAENLNYDIPDNLADLCYDNSADSCAKYGRLYNRVDALAACPTGWHLPSNEEWTTLTDFVGTKAGTKLKSSTGWYGYSGVPVGTDNYGFAALPGGTIDYSGYYSNFAGEAGFWWSSTKDNFGFYIWSMSVLEEAETVHSGRDGLGHSLYSVRCIQD